MFTIIAFILTFAGSINWFLIGVLQYDFVAGIFGYQGSILSRIIYVIIGISSFFLIYKVIKNKGILPIFSKQNKKDITRNLAKINQKTSRSQVEAGEENLPKKERYNDHNFEIYKDNEINNDEDLFLDEEEGLLNEHFDNDER